MKIKPASSNPEIGDQGTDDEHTADQGRGQAVADGDNERERGFGCGRGYSRFVANYPSAVLVAVLVCVLGLGAVAVFTGPLPSFEHPTKGFKARGTTLSARLLTYARHSDSEDSATVLYNPYPSTFNSSLSADGTFIVEDSDSSDSNLTTSVLRFTPSCQNVLSNPLRMVYQSDGGADMFSATVMRAVCQHDRENYRETDGFISYCYTDNSTRCPTWSLGHVTALVAGKDSCAGIVEADVEVLKTVLLECVDYYRASGACFDGTDDITCIGVPDNCTYYSTLIHTVFHYLTPDDFAAMVSEGNFALEYTLVAPPLPEWYWSDFYNDHISSSSLQGDSLRIIHVGIGGNFKLNLFASYLLSDSLYIGVGCAFVLLVIWMYVGSLFITLMTVLGMIMAMVVAYFLYHTIFRVPFFGFINVVTVVLVIGIGADDCFVYVDIWKLVKAEIGGGRVNHAMILQQTLKHASITMFVTSFTTSSALFAGIVSSITAIRTFSVFAGSSIIVNFVLTMTWIPAAVMIHEKYFLCNGNDEEGSSCKCCGCWFTVGRFYNRIARAGSTFFEVYLPIAINKLRILWIILLTGLGIGGFVVVFITPRLRLPSQSDFQVFRSSHILERYDQVYKKNFAFESDSARNLPAFVVWGIKALDNGDHWDPDSEGTTVMDETFDVTSEEAQQWLYEFCANFRNASFHDSDADPLREEGCFIDSFRDFMEGPCINPLDGGSLSPCCSQTHFPYTPDLFVQCAKVYSTIRCVLDPHICTYGSPGLFFSDDDTIVALTISLQTNIKLSQDYQEMSNFWQELNQFVDSQVDDAPAGMENGWFVSSHGWQLFFYDLQNGLATGAPLSVGVSLAVAAVVLLIAIRNVLVTLYAILTIAFAVFVVIASVVLLGWELNIFESTILSLAVGLSVDFTIHYGVSYGQAPDEDREGRSMFALRTLSAALTMAALTTFFAGAFMLPATVLSYVQLGTFLVLVMTISWFYGTFLFVSMCRTIGPQKSFAQISLSCFVRKTTSENTIEMTREDHAHEQHVDTSDER
ncbi:protein dispatched homolog 1-like [Diadema antillarum]